MDRSIETLASRGARSAGVALMILAATGCRGSDAEVAQRSAGDVLLVVVDTLRADRLGCYGGEVPSSPHIDRLAADGVIFDHVVSASSSTSPSMASILTGTYPRFNSYGISNGLYKLVPGEHTIPEYFLHAGYRTAAFIGNPVLRKRNGFHQGFEVYDHELDEREAVRRMAQRTARPLVEKAVGWLESLDEDERFFLWLHFMDPHGPYTPPADVLARFPVRASGPLVDGPSATRPNLGYCKVPLYQAILPTHELNEYERRYDSEIANADSALGHVLRWLEDSGRYEDATVVFTSDHGEAFGENGYYFCHGHAVTSDQSAVPLIVKHPGIEPNERSTVLASHVDILPTLVGLLDQAGAPVPDAGVDLAAIGEDPEPRTVFCEIEDRLAVHRGDLFLLGDLLDDEADGSVASVFDPDNIYSREDPFTPLPQVAASDWKRLEQAAHRYLEALEVEAESTPVSDDMVEMLEALGYSGDG